MKPFKHLRTILKHKRLVFYNSCKLGILYRGLVHDLSKFRPSEFIRSSKSYLGNKTPTIKERENNDGYSYIAVYHTNRNKHHWQYWLDYNSKEILVKKFPYKYALEYIADIMSASKTYNPKNYNGTVVLEYFKKHCVNYLLHPMTKAFIIECLNIYIDKGFKGIKKRVTKKIYFKLDLEYDDIIKLPFDNNWKNLLAYKEE